MKTPANHNCALWKFWKYVLFITIMEAKVFGLEMQAID